MSTRPAGDDGRWSDGEFPAGEAGDRLAAMFRAAAAPAHASELAGEEAAMAAFRAAAVAEPATKRSSTLRNVITKVLTVKAMVVLAVAGSAGIVVAATGGVLPTPWSAPPVEQPATTSAPAPTETSRRTADPVPSASAGAATPELVDLCRKYDHPGRKGKALDNPAFGPLIDAAGGAEKVARYCAAHTEDKHGDKHGPDARKTPPGKANGHENGNNGNDNGNGHDNGNGPDGNSPPDNSPPDNSGKPDDKGNPGNGHPGNPHEPKKTKAPASENAARSHPAASARTSTPGSPARGAASPPQRRTAVSGRLTRTQWVRARQPPPDDLARTHASAHPAPVSASPPGLPAKFTSAHTVLHRGLRSTPHRRASRFTSSSPRPPVASACRIRGWSVPPSSTSIRRPRP